LVGAGQRTAERKNGRAVKGAQMKVSKATRTTLFIGALALAAMVSMFAAFGILSKRNILGGAAEHFEGTQKRLVVVHAQWCGHCKELLKKDGVWDGVKKKLPGVTVEEIDEEADPETIKSLNITSFPTVLVMDGPSSVAQFEGERTVDGIVEFAMKHIKP